jgi:hypothetical protein
MRTGLLAILAIATASLVRASLVPTEDERISRCCNPAMHAIRLGEHAVRVAISREGVKALSARKVDVQIDDVAGARAALLQRSRSDPGAQRLAPASNDRDLTPARNAWHWRATIEI